MDMNLSNLKISWRGQRSLAYCSWWGHMFEVGHDYVQTEQQQQNESLNEH